MKSLLLAAAALLVLAAPVVPAKQKARECYCAPVPGAGGGMGEGAPYGVPAGEEVPCGGWRVAYRPKDVDKRAKLTELPQPGYTAEAKQNRVAGVVRLRVVLCPLGSVSNLTVVKGLPDGLTERAIAAAKKAKFEPAEKDGEKVPQWVVLEYNFQP
jgi:TonB family protein